MANVGFIGLGNMGSRMVKRLLDAGHSVTGYNRTRSKGDWLIQAGMRWGETPRAVVEASEITLSIVTDTRAVQAILNGPDGVLAGLSPGKIYIDMSTISPAASRSLSASVAEKGAQMLDAPVLGSIGTVEQGNLGILVGGKQEIFEQVRPILQAIGPDVTYVGENGLAATLKICLNLNLAVQMLAFSEGVLLAEKSGISREEAVRVMSSSVVGSPMLKYRGPFVLKIPEEAWFNVNMMQKDMNLALDLGRQLEVPLPTTAVANEFLTAARAMSWGQADYAIVFNVLARMAGIEES